MAKANERFLKRLRKATRLVLFPRRFREIACEGCGRPYLEFAEREPTHSCLTGHACVHVYVDQSDFRSKYWFRAGLYKPSHDGFYFGQLFSESDFEPLIESLTKAFEFVAAHKEAKKSMVAWKMSSTSPSNN